MGRCRTRAALQRVDLCLELSHGSLRGLQLSIRLARASLRLLRCLRLLLLLLGILLPLRRQVSPPETAARRLTRRLPHSQRRPRQPVQSFGMYSGGRLMVAARETAA